MQQTNIMFPLSAKPDARAQIKGSSDHPQLGGLVDFYRAGSGVVVIANLWDLPRQAATCDQSFFAFHIHEGGACSGSPAFSNALGHYNPKSCSHPAHAGDLPPLLSNGGYAWQAVYTERFTIPEVLGRTVVIHSGRDDFTSQPAGNAGSRIGCGVIERIR